MLHGAADAEGDVERRVDDHAGRADLALVGDPSPVGDHPRGAHRRAEGARPGRRAAGTARRSSRPAPPPTIRSRLGEIHRRDVRRQHLDHRGVAGRRRAPASRRRHRPARGTRDAGSATTPRTPGCSVTTTGPPTATSCSVESPPRPSSDVSGRDADRTGEQRATEDMGQAGARSRPSGEPGSTTTARRRPAGRGRRAQRAAANGPSSSRRDVVADAGQLVGGSTTIRRAPPARRTRRPLRHRRRAARRCAPAPAPTSALRVRAARRPAARPPAHGERRGVAPGPRPRACGRAGSWAASGPLGGLAAEVAHDLDDHGDRQRGAEREDERQRVVVLERLAEDAAEHRRVRRPDHRGDGDPRREPAPRLVGDPRRERQRGPPAGDEPGGDQQQPAALADLLARPRPGVVALRPLRRPAVEPRREPPADRVRDVVAEERAERAGAG